MIEFVKTVINLPNYLSNLERKRFIMIDLYDVQQKRIEELSARIEELERHESIPRTR